MTTTSGPTLGPQTQTHVKDMPPLVTTTTGIPDAEHAAAAPQTEKKSRLNLWVALALAGVLAVMIGAIAYVFMQPVEPTITTTTQTTSRSAEAADYLAGKRAAAAAAAGISPVSAVSQAQLDRLAHYPVW